MRLVLAFTILLCGTLQFATAEPLLIEGRVSAADGQLLSEASVQLVELRDQYLTPEDCLSRAEARTNSEGLFSLRAEVPTTIPLALLASAPGHRLARFPFDRKYAFRKVALALEPGSTVLGRVQDTDGKPISTALLGPLTGAVPGSTEPVIPQWARSGSDGRFTFAGVPQNALCSFVIRAPGYKTAAFNAAAGQSVEAVLEKGGHDLKGVVRCGSQPPPPGTRVLVKSPELQDAVTPDFNGNFVLRGLPPGDYMLQAVAPDRRAARTAAVSLPHDAASTWTLEVSPGYMVSGSTVDSETSSPAEGVIVRFEEPGGEAHETLSGADGFFRAGPFFQEELPRVSFPPEGGFRSAAFLGDSSDLNPAADGFENVENWVLRVRRQRTIMATVHNLGQATEPVVLALHGPEGPRGRTERTLVTSSTAAMDVFSGGTYYLWGTSGGLATAVHTFDFGSESSRTLALALGPAGAVSGRVLLEHADGSTSPALGCSVRLFLDAETSSPLETAATSDTVAREWLREFREIARARAAPDGSFQFFPVAPGRYLLEVENQSGTARQSRELTVEPGSNRSAEFLLPAGKEISGIVVKPDGEAVHGATIRIRVRGAGAGAGVQLVLHTDQDGLFRASDVDADELESLRVELSGFSMERIGPQPLPARDLQILLNKEGLLRARVEAPSTSRWRVMLMAAEPWRDRTCPEQLISRVSGWPMSVQGQEEAVFEVPPGGRYRIAAVGQGGSVAVSEPFTWAAGDETDREMVLHPDAAGAVTGTSEDQEGLEITAWNTSLPEEPGVKAEFKTAGAGGQFSFAALPPGDYLITATGEAAYFLEPNVQVTPGGNTTVHLKSEQQQKVSGTVRLNGTPVPDATVELISQSDSGFQVRRTRTGSNGEFAIDDLQPDEYLVTISTESDGKLLSRSASVNVTRGGPSRPVHVELGLPETVSVSASVLTPLGFKPGVTVTFRNAETGETISGEPASHGGVDAPLGAGSYDIWLDGEPSGTAAVGSDGAVRISR